MGWPSTSRAKAGCASAPASANAAAAIRRWGWRTRRGKRSRMGWILLFFKLLQASSSARAAFRPRCLVQRGGRRRGRQRPLYVLGDQRARVGNRGLQGGADRCRGLAGGEGIAQRDGEVAAPALEADA